MIDYLLVFGDTMHNLSNLVVTLCALTLAAAPAAQSSFKRKSPYPNELPNLRIYEQARWNSLKPFISTIDDVEKLLGEPVPVLDNRLKSDFGFESHPDWTIIINLVGHGGELSDSVAGRLLLINLYPKKRVSLVGADFAAFRGYAYTDGNKKSVYYDEFGLRYVMHAEDAADGSFRAGDLVRIIYGPSDRTTAKYSQKRNGSSYP